MFKTLRARLWIGYSLLILLILSAFFVGLFITLNRTSALYRQIDLQLRVEEQILMQQIGLNPADVLSVVTTSLIERPAGDTLRILLLDNIGNVSFDSDEASGSTIQWKSLAAIRRSENINSSQLIKDSNGKVWIYIARKLPDNKQFLIIASPRENLTLNFMLSDPMIRLILRVLLFSIFVSLILSFLMDRWITRPIRKMSLAAETMALVEHKDLSLEGPKEVRDLADSLNKMSRQVRESQQSQRDFISDVSHELKTPLTSVQGFANAIADGTANDEKNIKHAAQVIVAESERMLRLVMDLLTLTRLEGGVENLHKSPVNFNDLVTSVVEKMSIAARIVDVTIENKVQGLPLINADADRITQVITNLVDNAIKYSKTGDQVILSSNLDEQTIQIRVIDHGIGISKENLTKIFNRFYQVDKSRAGGTRKSAGLGLPIARQIALAHGGDILVTSEIGHGTIFTLVLPVANIR